jgi:hypothetical protein
VINVFNGEIKFILMVLCGPAVFCASVREYTKQRNLMLFKERQHPIIEQIGCHQCVFAVIEFGIGYFAIRLHKGLLINPAHSSRGAHIVSVLCS